ncbi:hypothetical protein [Bacillus sp. V5-8f]|uniref:hypothetical protein n=1 Tax=Bacillus sp. V5-8f TaxID=2053044 RepID=UPI000C769020|nr:hypothetical protein [Bacillus sp. V5-8f]PLT32070.1 hypothetical protein CUU64_21110 [Bacillus sp. V5-8f]
MQGIWKKGSKITKATDVYKNPLLLTIAGILLLLTAVFGLALSISTTWEAKTSLNPKVPVKETLDRRTYQAMF